MTIVNVSIPSLPSGPLTDRALMTLVGQRAIALIKLRTMRGVDMEGRPFEAYSPGYAVRKAKDLGYAGPPNLSVSGDMLNGLIIRAVDETSVTLGWAR